MIRVSSFRFFMAVSPPPVWFKVALAATVLVGLATLWLNPADVDSAYGGVLLLQMFGVSAGFTTQAARGYFDPVLVLGRDRRRIGLACFAATVLPGVAAWSALALWASALGRHAEAFTPSRVVALALVSCAGWAVGLSLPRLTAGALWAVVMIALTTSRWAPHLIATFERVPSGPADVLRVALMTVACPFLLLGRFAATGDARVLTVDVMFAAGALWAGARYIARRDYPMVEPA